MLATIEIGKVGRELTDANRSCPSIGLVEPQGSRAVRERHIGVDVGGTDIGAGGPVLRHAVRRAGRSTPSRRYIEIAAPSRRTTEAKYFSNVAGYDRSRDHPDKLAVPPGQPMGDNGCPSTGDAAPHQFDLNWRRLTARLEER